MNAVYFSELRKNLKKYMDKVYMEDDPLIVTRKNNENVVMISMQEYNSLIETNYLMANEANAKHLMKSMSEVKSKKPGKVIKSEDLLKE